MWKVVGPTSKRLTDQRPDHVMAVTAMAMRPIPPVTGYEGRRAGDGGRRIQAGDYRGSAWYTPNTMDGPVRLLDLPVTVLLILSVLVVSLWGWIFKPAQRWMILIPYRVRHGGEVHRMFTAGWAHANLSHLFFNMLALYFFAGWTTQTLGTPRFLILYLTAVVAGFVPSTLFNLENPRFATLGASGAVAAVMFSGILLHPTRRLFLLFMPLPIPAVVFAAAYLAYSVWHSLDQGDGVNHDAHISGALYGSLLTYLFEPERVERSIRILVHFFQHLTGAVR